MTKLSFPPSTINKLKGLRLKESDIVDVFYKGETTKTPTGTWMATRKYTSYGYEIGIYYTTDKYTGGYVVTAVWKRERR